MKCLIPCPRVPAGHSWEPWCLPGLEWLSAAWMLLQSHGLGDQGEDSPPCLGSRASGRTPTLLGRP